MAHPTDFVTIYIVLKIFLFKKNQEKKTTTTTTTTTTTKKTKKTTNIILLMGIDPRREVVFSTAGLHLRSLIV